MQCPTGVVVIIGWPTGHSHATERVSGVSVQLCATVHTSSPARQTLPGGERHLSVTEHQKYCILVALRRGVTVASRLRTALGAKLVSLPQRDASSVSNQ